jgi:GNAT superfamily N-acetyltransferase
MYLQPEHRGRGLGRTLLNHAIHWAKDRGCRSIVLDTSTAMTAAQRLHESAGFARTGTRTENRSSRLPLRSPLQARPRALA